MRRTLFILAFMYFSIDAIFFLINSGWPFTLPQWILVFMVIGMIAFSGYQWKMLRKEEKEKKEALKEEEEKLKQLEAERESIIDVQAEDVENQEEKADVFEEDTEVIAEESEEEAYSASKFDE